MIPWVGIIIHPKKELLFADLHLDERKYKKTDNEGHGPPYYYYTNEEHGIQYEVTQGRVMSIVYSAAAEDAKKLRCTLSATTVNDWRGIVPLHSTVDTVETILGRSDDPCRCRFKTPNESVVIDYAKGPCKGPPYGWNVLAGTVLQIKVYPRQETQISEQELLKQNFVKSSEIDTPTLFYTNVQRGLRYAVYDGKISSVSYIPTSNNISLRCQGFPEYDGGLREYHPYSVFSKKAQLIDERISEFALQLANNPSVVGYVITYGGAVSKKGEAKAMGEYAKRVITAKNRVPSARVIIIDGGFRGDAEFELFLVPNEMPPPAPTPTLATNQVKIVASSPRRSRHRRQLLIP